MVFEKAQAPNNKTEFIKWYENQVEWKEDHNYDSIVYGYDTSISTDGRRICS